MSERQIFLDRGLGESRGVVTLDGRPERLLIRRDDDDPRLAFGARLVARVESLEPSLGTAFLDLGKGLGAILPFKPDAKPARGASVEVEIRGEPRRGKLAVARLVGPSEGAPRILAEAPSLPELLQGFARGVDIVEGRAAREAADEAEADALEIIHPLAGGGSLAIEPTRALTAIDVDLGERKGGDAKRVTRQANLLALKEAARLLRLKGLGGVVVLDLVGRGHDGNALLAAARAAFAPDNPGVAIGPVGRFGTMEISLPRRARPIAETLCDERGRLTARTLALRLVRQVEREAAANGGSQIEAACSAEVATEAGPLFARLADRIGARAQLRTEAGWPRERIEAAAR